MAPLTGYAGPGSTQLRVLRRCWATTTMAVGRSPRRSLDERRKFGSRYRRNTLVLETEFTAADGSAAVLIDFMPVRQGLAESRLIRLVVGKRGAMAMRSELIVRFGYGGW